MSRLLVSCLAIALASPILAAPIPALAAPTPALAAPPAPVASQATPRARVEALLRAYHATPDRAAFEAAAGPTADPAKLLRALAADPQTFAPARRAAFDALRSWPDDHTFALYQTHLAPDHPTGLRHTVLRALVVFGDRALPLLHAALTGPEVELRITAAYALFDLPGDAARELIRARAKVEPDAHARREMDRLLTQRAILR